MRSFPLAAVRLLDGPFKHAQDADVRYALALDPDRLCAPYLREAGLAPEVAGYGNWEGDGMGGHIGGHYLSACAQLWAATGDDRLRDRLERVLDVFEQCQQAVGTGFLGGVPGGSALGDELAAGVIDADTFNLNGRWVPLYNLHKTLAGLLDAATFGESERALKMAMSWADWWLSISRSLTDEAFEEMLHTEFGGMADAFAALAEVTGRAEYLAEATRFTHRELLEPLAQRRDVLDGLHANTQIAKVVGYARLAALTGDDEHRAAAEYFWRNVTRHRTVAIGGNSVREHFHAADDFAPMVQERQGPETCNTYNMLKLTALLFEATGDPSLLDYYERATINHVLSSQHPEHGGLVYFTPLRPGHYRVYSQPETSMWCCVGSGMENHARYGQVVFGQSDGDLVVNLYLAAALDWADRGLAVRLEADLLTSDTAVLHLSAAPVNLAVRLRRPGWADGVDVEVDGEPADVSDDGGYLVVRRSWSGDHTVTVRFTTGLAVDPLPDGSNWAAFRWGPVVLAARCGDDRLDGLLAGEQRMGHVAAGPVRPLAATPIIASDDPLDAAVLVSRAPLAVELTVWPDGAAASTTVRLEPFTAIHDERYTLYWPVGRDVQPRRAQLAALDRAETPDLVVVDDVAAGEQQPESDHAFAGERTRAHAIHGTHTRSATGWFSYTLRDPDASARLLRVTFVEPDPADPRGHELRVNGTVPGEPAATNAADGLVHFDYALDATVRGDDSEGRLVVSVHARDGLATGELSRVRLIGGQI